MSRTQDRGIAIVAATLHDTLVRLGYAHVPAAGGAFSRGIYAGGQLVFVGGWEAAWFWLVLSKQIHPTPLIEKWMRELRERGGDPVEVVQTGMQEALAARQQMNQAATAAQETRA